MSLSPCFPSPATPVGLPQLRSAAHLMLTFILDGDLQEHCFQGNFTSGCALGLANDSLQQWLASLTGEKVLWGHRPGPRRYSETPSGNHLARSISNQRALHIKKQNQKTNPPCIVFLGVSPKLLEKSFSPETHGVSLRDPPQGPASCQLDGFPWEFLSTA